MAQVVKEGLKKVYFPNIVFRMVRSPGLQPNQVAFRIPPKVNKLDVKSYLQNIYNVRVLDVRTMNYQGGVKNTLRGKERESSYKKAVVTLDHHFKYPTEPNLEEMGVNQADLMRGVADRKLRGWRIRPRKEVKDQLNAMYSKASEEKK
ncbi:mitochondrial 54S ribosomal protein uL23m [Calcarisporiella thermophila]|uniref:mitochondrial 54S ribosomal protein uL23m n=1 Tax=Calcarisporiella thermophila TaxID=911321 RepID=UPI003743F8B9